MHEKEKKGGLRIGLGGTRRMHREETKGGSRIESGGA
jgi:hypothetical protein